MTWGAICILIDSLIGSVAGTAALLLKSKNNTFKSKNFLFFGGNVQYLTQSNVEQCFDLLDIRKKVKNAAQPPTNQDICSHVDHI